MNLRYAALAALAVLGLAVVLAPWFELDTYTPNGWDATWWARGALAAAIVAIVALRIGRDREAAGLAALALACIVFRAIVPPDFGLGFDGLDVPTERSWGLWVALGAALLGFAAAAAIVRGGRDPAAS